MKTGRSLRQHDVFEPARLLADAVLYEGYVLYPYRASASKNQLRWQFGVVAPRAFAEVDGSEDWSMQTECIAEAGDDASLDVKVRFLRVQERRVEKAPGGGAFTPVASLEHDGSLLTSFDEATEEVVDLGDLRLADLVAGGEAVSVDLAASQQIETLRDGEGRVVARVVRERRAISGMVRVAAESYEGPWPLVKLRVRIENLTAWPGPAPGGQAWPGPGASRDDVVRRSLVAVHTLMAVRNGAFISLFDPPEFARPAAASCVNHHTWPILVGDEGQRDVVLSSPVTLYDYAEVAAESAGDFFDSTEIDEMLALRVMTLTDEEKREARGTDARAAAIVDRCDDMPTEVFERLHGAVRYLRTVGAEGTQGDKTPAGLEPERPSRAGNTGPPPAPAGVSAGPGARRQAAQWDPGADASVNPFEDRVWVGSVEVGRGTSVLLRPNRRADAHDLFLAGRTATVQAVLQDVDGDTHLAVSVGDDPDEMDQWHGRFLYFYPDEVEPLGPERPLPSGAAGPERPLPSGTAGAQ